MVTVDIEIFQFIRYLTRLICKFIIAVGTTYGIIPIFIYGINTLGDIFFSMLDGLPFRTLLYRGIWRVREAVSIANVLARLVLL